MNASGGTEPMTPGAMPPEALAAAVAADLTATLGGSVDVEVGGLVRGGFVQHLVSVRLKGAGLPHDWPRRAVVRLSADAADGRDTAQVRRVHDFCRQRGYPAVRVLHDGTVGRHGYLLIEHVDAPEITGHLVRPWHRTEAVRRLATLHASLHRLPTDGWSGPVRGARAWNSDLAAAGAAEPALREPVAWLEANRPGDDDTAVCHFDFASANVLSRWDGEPTVIDWDTAGLGDPAADVGFAIEKLDLIRSFLPVAGRAILPAGETYAAAYEAVAPLDRTRLPYWRAQYCVVIRALAAGATVGGIRVDGSRSRQMRRLASIAVKRFEAHTRVG